MVAATTDSHLAQPHSEQFIMSGVEAVSLALAAIPLIIDAFDHSKKTIQAFSTYRGYPKEVKKLESKLGAQKTVFRNNCINLFSTLTDDPQIVQDMFSARPLHGLWSKGHLTQILTYHLDSLDQTFDSCQQTMEQISQALQAISNDTERFNAVLDRNLEKEPIGSRGWCRYVGRKLKLSLQKPQIEKHLEELKGFNDDFNLMSNQAIECICRLGREGNHRLIPVTGRTCLEKYHNIRKASQNFYEALVNGWSCSIHAKHSAYICLEGDEADPEHAAHTTLPIVHFDVAVTYVAGGSTPTEYPILLEVESTVDQLGDILGKKENHAAYDDLIKRVKDQADRLLNTARGNEMDLVTMTPKTENRNVNSRSAIHLSPAESYPAHDSVLDLCTVEDFCRHFTQQPQATLPEARDCIGYLKNPCIHRFYRRPTRDLPTTQFTSLADVISWVAEDSATRKLSRPAILQLGHSLASAVLRFHSTPWLSESWSSGNIHLHGIDYLQQPQLLKSPYLNIEFTQSAMERITDPSERPPLGSVPSHNVVCSYARNVLLFHLGVVLIELGFVKPWRVLKESIFESLPRNRSTDSHVADRLVQKLVRQMGPHYAKIVSMCLGCDFGLGETDLSSEGLQQRFFLDIVMALESLGAEISSVITL